jgi:hypothetical protein
MFFWCEDTWPFIICSSSEMSVAVYGLESLVLEDGSSIVVFVGISGKLNFYLLLSEFFDC